MTTDFIAHDWCGWNERYGRFTHLPSGDTLVCQEWMGQSDWDKVQLEWFSKYPGLDVHECPAVYDRSGPLMGTTEEICARLAERLMP